MSSHSHKSSASPSGNPARVGMLAAIVATCLFTSCGGPVKSDAGPRVLATVGNATITEVDFLAEVERRRTRRQPVPGKEELLAEMIDRLALIERAKAEGLESDPEVERTYGNLLAGKLRERDLQQDLARAKVTDEEIEAEYQRSLDRYTVPAKAKFAILFLATNTTMRPEKVEELRARLVEAREKHLENPPTGSRGPGGKGFGSLAISYSEEPTSRYRGGDIGWLDLGRDGYRWPQAVVDTGFALENTGDVSEIIETAGGLYLVMRTDSRPASQTPLEKVKSSLQRRLVQAKQKQLQAEFQSRTREITDVTTHPDALAAVELPAAASTPVQTAGAESTPPPLPR